MGVLNSSVRLNSSRCGFFQIKSHALDAVGAGADAGLYSTDHHRHIMQVWCKRPDRGLGTLFPLSTGHPGVVRMRSAGVRFL